MQFMHSYYNSNKKYGENLKEEINFWPNTRFFELRLNFKSSTRLAKYEARRETILASEMQGESKRLGTFKAIQKRRKSHLGRKMFKFD